MKKNVSFILVFLLILSVFSGCGNGSDNAKHYGDELTNDTLRVCVDCWSFSGKYSSNPSDHEYEVGVFLEDLAQDIKSACSIEKIVFEVLPHNGAERETALQRLRTEIMAGGGPDVFIMETVLDMLEDEKIAGVESREALFTFPEKNMESGLFLPLDEYMANNTQFTDWSNQTKAVMDAGRSGDGQVIIPMKYTLPIWVYPKSKVDPAISEMTMWEILENAETAELGAVLYTSHVRTDSSGDRASRSFLQYILGELADYENEELLFTEDELYEVIETAYSLRDDVEKNQLQYIESSADYDLVYQINLAYFDEDMTLVPLYSADGGVTASIRSYAAVNRNTKFPKEAFSVIDYIMQEDMQRNSYLYYKYYANGLPMQNDLGQEGKSLYANSLTERVLDEPYFEDLLSIKDQIAAVNFQNGLDSVLHELMADISFDHNINGATTIDRAVISEAYEKMKRMMGE